MPSFRLPSPLGRCLEGPCGCLSTRDNGRERRPGLPPLCCGSRASPLPRHPGTLPVGGADDPGCPLGPWLCLSTCPRTPWSGFGGGADRARSPEPGEPGDWMRPVRLQMSQRRGLWPARCTSPSGPGSPGPVKGQRPHPAPRPHPCVLSLCEALAALGDAWGVWSPTWGRSTALPGRVAREWLREKELRVQSFPVSTGSPSQGA